MATGDLALQQITNDRDSGTSQIGLLQNPFPPDRVEVSLVNKGFILKPNLGLLHDSIDFMLNPEKRIINRHHMELGKGIPRGDLPPIQIFMHFRRSMFGEHREQAVQTRVTHSVDTAKQGEPNRGF